MRAYLPLRDYFSTVLYARVSPIYGWCLSIRVSLHLWLLLCCTDARVFPHSWLLFCCTDAHVPPIRTRGCGYSSIFVATTDPP